MRLYKLTNKSRETYDRTRWQLGMWQEVPGRGKLCTGGWLHAYESPLVAVMMNPIHGQFMSPRLFLAEGRGRMKRDGQLKVGVQGLRLVEEMAVPRVSLAAKMRVAVMCVKSVFNGRSHGKVARRWTRWANAWLSGRDRSAMSALRTLKDLIGSLRSFSQAGSAAEHVTRAARYATVRINVPTVSWEARCEVAYAIRAVTRIAKNKESRSSLHGMIIKAVKRERKGR